MLEFEIDFEVFKDFQNSMSPKDKRYLRSLKNSRVRVFPNCTRTAPSQIMLLKQKPYCKIYRVRWAAVQFGNYIYDFAIDFNIYFITIWLFAI